MINFAVKLFSSNDNIFIWGLGQSGTFLLADLLSYSLFDTHAFASVPPLRKKGICNRQQTIETLGITKCLQEGKPWFWDTHFKIMTNEITRPCKLSYNSYNYSRLGMLITRYRYLRLAQANKKLVLDKSPNYMNMLPLINRLFPNATHLFVVRDPKKTIESQLKRLEPFNKYDRVPKKDGSLSVNSGWPSGWYGDIYDETWNCEGWSDYGRHAYQHYNQISKALSYCTESKLNVHILKFDHLLKDSAQFCDSITKIPALRKLNRSMFLKAAETGIIHTGQEQKECNNKRSKYEETYNSFFGLNSIRCCFKLTKPFPVLNNSRSTYDPETIP